MRALFASSLLVALGCGGGSAVEPVVTSRTSPLAEFFPTSSGHCPNLTDGYVTFTPSGIAPRRVRLWLAPGVSLAGPLVFYWHGTGSAPEEALYGLGDPTVDAIKAAGGIVAAPEHDLKSAQFPWYLTMGAGREDDLLVADEVLACAREQRGVDERRIHSVGMSAGGLQTVQMAYRRSGYIASVVPYSGGLLGFPLDQDPENHFAAMIFFGGAKDQVIANFQALSRAFHDDLGALGRFSFLCNHGMGHTIPIAARPSVWEFLQAHPFGTVPSPYAAGLPPTFPEYCTLD